jgi:chemotaxis-related protein WspB
MLYLLFYLGSDRYAVDAAHIVEILPLVTIKRALLSPAGIVGTINYRGVFVPVVDLSELAVGQPAPPRLSTRIIIIRCPQQDGNGRLLGLVAERAAETVRCSPSDFVSSGYANERAPYLGPIALGPRGTMQRIEVNKLFAASLACASLEQCA